jgi:hypothetical protein
VNFAQKLSNSLLKPEIMKTRKTTRKLVQKQPRVKKKRTMPINQLVSPGEFEAEEKLAEDYFSSEETWEPRKSKGADEEL